MYSVNLSKVGIIIEDNKENDEEKSKNKTVLVLV